VIHGVAEFGKHPRIEISRFNQFFELVQFAGGGFQSCRDG
jgi:hypothetical protein